MINTFTGLASLTVTEYDNAHIIGDHTCINKNGYDEAKLAQLKEEYDLSGIIKAGQTDWDKMVLLRKWVNSRWIHGWSKVPEGGNAVDVLKAAEKGDNFACGTYSSVFHQCCCALGFMARLLSILRDKSDVPDPSDALNTGHVVTEVWTNHYQKWAVMDTDLNCHYEINKIPLNAFEIRKAWLSGKEDEVLQVPLIDIKDRIPDLSGDEQKEYIRNFYEIAEKMMGREFAEKYHSNYMHIRENALRFIEHKTLPYYTYIIVPSGKKRYMFAEKNSAPLLLVNEYPIQRAWPDIEWTSDVSKAYFSINQTFIYLSVIDDTKNSIRLQVTLSNTTPYFREYLISINNSDWKSAQNEFIWDIKQGENTIRALAVNGFGEKGIESIISIEYTMR